MLSAPGCTSSTARRCRRRSRQPVARPRSVRFALTSQEYDEVSSAADEAGLARGAYAAMATLAVARGAIRPAGNPVQATLGELIRAAQQVRRIGVNLNQAVARLHVTGQRSADLVPLAAESIRRAERLDAVAEEMRRLLR